MKLWCHNIVAPPLSYQAKGTYLPSKACLKGARAKGSSQRPVGNSRRDRRWTEEQDSLLRLLWPTSTKEVLLAAFPNRQLGGICSRAAKIYLGRQVRHYPPRWKGWTDSDDARLAALYVTETPIEDIAAELGRSKQAVLSRACLLKIKRPREIRFASPKVAWEVQNFYGLEAVCSRVLPNPAAEGLRNRQQRNGSGSPEPYTAYERDTFRQACQYYRG